ncbi:TPA: restriction endonuclease subunit S [Streptococcus suis]|nr:restriction endonuclease subunit S [Streptococcus suis]
MTRMKDSGIEWIGEVPEEWGITRLKYICGMQSGNNLTSLEISSENDGGKIFPVYGGNGQRGYYSDFTNEGNYCLVGRQGALAGNIHFVSGKFWATDHAIVVYEHAHTYSKYLYYLLKAMNLNQYAFETSAQPGLSVEKILQLETIHCPKGEQSQIADFLDKKVAQLDKVKSLLEEQIKTLEDYRQSLIYETVTKGLDKTVPLKDSGVDWIGQIPEGWEVKKHKYIMSKTKTLCSHYSGQKILSLTRQGVISRDVESGKGKMPASFDGYQFLTRGDLLLCLFDIDVTPRCVGVVESDGLTSPAYSRFKVSEDSSAYYYYYLFLSMDDDKVLLHLAKNLRNSLTEDDFGDIETIVPSYKEQVIIANYLNKKTLLIDKLIKLKKEQIENINKQRQTLIYDYVTGKRRI